MPRCKKTVYQAEEVVAAGKHWHKGCFSCADCKKKLDSTTLSVRKNVGEEEIEIFCKNEFCHRSLSLFANEQFIHFFRFRPNRKREKSATLFFK